MLNLSTWAPLWEDLNGCTVTLSGCGEDALAVAREFQDHGVIVLTLSSDEGWIYDYEDVNVDAARECRSLKDYMAKRPLSKFDYVSRVWEAPCDVAVACEGGITMNAGDVKRLAANGCKIFAGAVEDAAKAVIADMGLTYIA